MSTVREENHVTLENDPKYCEDIQKLKSTIVTYKDFPRPNITYKDAFDSIKSSDGFKKTIDILADVIKKVKPDYIVGLESRGFILIGALSYALNIPFVLMRKKNKLPGSCKSIKYDLHYGDDCLEIQEDSIKSGQTAVIVDDAVATGGTMKAAIDLINSIGGIVLGSFVLLELDNLGWEKKLTKQKVTSLFRL